MLRATDESRSVGWGGDDGESVGHESGRKIVAIKRKTKDELTEADYEHMRKVVGYTRRHLAPWMRKSCLLAEEPARPT